MIYLIFLVTKALLGDLPNFFVMKALLGDLPNFFSDECFVG